MLARAIGKSAQALVVVHAGAKEDRRPDTRAEHTGNSKISLVRFARRDGVEGGGWWVGICPDRAPPNCCLNFGQSGSMESGPSQLLSKLRPRPTTHHPPPPPRRVSVLPALAGGGVVTLEEDDAPDGAPRARARVARPLPPPAGPSGPPSVGGGGRPRRPRLDTRSEKIFSDPVPHGRFAMQKRVYFGEEIFSKFSNFPIFQHYPRRLNVAPRRRPAGRRAAPGEGAEAAAGAAAAGAPPAAASRLGGWLVSGSSADDADGAAGAGAGADAAADEEGEGEGEGGEGEEGGAAAAVALPLPPRRPRPAPGGRAWGLRMAWEMVGLGSCEFRAPKAKHAEAKHAEAKHA
eukprot:gene3341-biopygen4856